MSREFVDPYVYPGSNVLRNIPGLRTNEVLRDYEYEQAGHRASELRDKPIAGDFDLAHLRAIHKHLFQDVYAWAGDLRTVNMSKSGQRFTSNANIESHSERLADGLSSDGYLRDLNKPEFVVSFAQRYVEFNEVHPFREGNGRALREFFGQLAKEAGYELDQRQLTNDPQAWNRASAAAYDGDLGPIRKAFDEALRPERAVAFERVSREEALSRHPELKGAFETLRAAEAYASTAVREQGARDAFLSKIYQRVRDTLDAGKVVLDPGRKPRERGHDR